MRLVGALERQVLQRQLLVRTIYSLNRSDSYKKYRKTSKEITESMTLIITANSSQFIANLNRTLRCDPAINV